MTGQFTSYLNPKCNSGQFEEKGGCGVFAARQLKKESCWRFLAATLQRETNSIPICTTSRSEFFRSKMIFI